jgi:hypothetical protein
MGLTRRREASHGRRGGSLGGVHLALRCCSPVGAEPRQIMVALEKGERVGAAIIAPMCSLLELGPQSIQGVTFGQVRWRSVVGFDAQRYQGRACHLR